MNDFKRNQWHISGGVTKRYFVSLCHQKAFDKISGTFHLAQRVRSIKRGASIFADIGEECSNYFYSQIRGYGGKISGMSKAMHKGEWTAAKCCLTSAIVCASPNPGERQKESKQREYQDLQAFFSPCSPLLQLSLLWRRVSHLTSYYHCQSPHSYFQSPELLQQPHLIQPSPVLPQPPFTPYRLVLQCGHKAALLVLSGSLRTADSQAQPPKWWIWALF